MIAGNLGLTWLLWMGLLPVFSTLWLGVGIGLSQRKGSLYFFLLYWIIQATTGTIAILTLIAPWFALELTLIGLGAAGMGAWISRSILHRGLQNNAFELRLKPEA